jgi:hypothetical protein
MQGIFVFLDVEGPPRQSLNAEYYRGWSDALIAGGKSDMVFRDNGDGDPITFWPGVYGTHGDDETWKALVIATADGAVCRGTWIARLLRTGCHPLGPWNEQFIRPTSLPTSVACLALAGRARMSKHRLQPGKPRYFDKSHVGLGSSALKRRMADFLNSLLVPITAQEIAEHDPIRHPPVLSKC